MGWGSEPHEGWADAQYHDGSWNNGTTRGGDPDPVANQAACSCGWRSEHIHPLPSRPENVPRDERGVSFGPEWDAWTAELGRIEDACRDDWSAEHYEPLLGYEPHTQLILAESPGGRRHYLNGEPVHAGTRLEVLMPDGGWLPVRYEWNFQAGTQPTAYFALAAPSREAAELGEHPVVSFVLPTRAILRWPPQP